MMMRYQNNDSYIESGVDGEEFQGQRETLRGLLDLCFVEAQPGYYVPRPDISGMIDSEERSKIANRIRADYDLDSSDRGPDEKIWSQAMDHAMQVYESKDPDGVNPGMANIKYPLLTTAAIQFNARSYPEIIKPYEGVRCRVIGFDPDGSREARAYRISKHMSYQLSEVMEDWETESDQLLLSLPILGCLFRKTYFDPNLQANCSNLVFPQYLVVNPNVKTLKTARRLFHKVTYYKNDVEEMQRLGIWRDVDLGLVSIGSDDDPQHEFLECAIWHDLDDDGYQEPYTVTYHDQSGEIVRIFPRFDPVTSVQIGYGRTQLLEKSIYLQNVVRKSGIVVNKDGKILKIWPIQEYTKFSFLPSPDGSFYSIGLGKLLYPITEAIDTLFNQSLDAGTLANQVGGFITKGLRMKAGRIKFKPFEFKPIDASAQELKEGLVPFQFPGPNAVLFQLLGMLMESGKDIANSKDVLTGEAMGKNESPTTVLALIEQGMKVFNGIYKRILRSFKEEYEKLYRLNRVYMDTQEYFQVLNEQLVVSQQDYADDLDIQPVADPNLVTDMQRYAKAQAVMQVSAGNPLINQQEALLRYFTALGIDAPEKLIVPPNNQPPPQLVAQFEELGKKIQKLEEEALNIRADTMTKLAALLPVLPFVASASEQVKGVVDERDNGRPVAGMAEPPGNPENNPVPGGQPGSPEGEMGVGGIAGEPGQVASIGANPAMGPVPGSANDQQLLQQPSVEQ